MLGDFGGVGSEVYRNSMKVLHNRDKNEFWYRPDLLYLMK
jgi:hypothetical protein